MGKRGGAQIPTAGMHRAMIEASSAKETVCPKNIFNVLDRKGELVSSVEAASLAAAKIIAQVPKNGTVVPFFPKT
jgi:hypothetical protein